MHEIERIPFTGERFVPEKTDLLLSMEHFTRYQSIANMVGNKYVLDVACGEGYGSNLLSYKAQKVCGVDVSIEAVENARKWYLRNNLEFFVADATKLPFQDGIFDMVVSFETIEHLSEENQHLFLSEAKRVLKPDGLLVISTPDINIYNKYDKIPNHFHIKEFSKDEFNEFLNQYFTYTKIYNQNFETVNYIIPDKHDAVNGAITLNDYQGVGKYLIAAASQQMDSVANLDLSYVAFPNDELHDKDTDRIIQTQNEIKERNEHLRVLDQQIVEKDHYIIQLQKEKSEIDQYIKILLESENALQDQLRNSRGHIAHLTESGQKYQEELRNSRGHITLLIESEQKYQEELRNSRGHIALLIENEQKLYANVQFLQTEIEAQKYRIELLFEKERELQNDLSEKESYIDHLLESERQKVNELNGIYTSRTWRLLTILRRIISFFLPPQSKRRLFLSLFLRACRHPGRYIKKLNPRSIHNFRKAMKEGGVEKINEKINNLEIIHDGIPPKPIDLIDMQKTTFTKLVFPSFEKPKVTIIVPVYNQFSYTYGCLLSILTQTSDVAYEVIIADDCSTDLTKDITKYADNVVVCRPESNFGFLRNCNHAAAAARGTYIHFLNNDTNVQNNWLSSLVALMDSDDRIGMTGSKLVYPDGRLQEAGGILWEDGSAWNYGKFSNAEAPEFNYVKEVDYISGASIMIRKSLWEEIGGFDERFAPAYCEDSDLAFEVRKHGFQVVYQPQSVVVHYEGITNGTDLSRGVKGYQVTNSEKFKAKWAHELQADGFPNGEHVFDARDRSRRKPTILMVDHYVPQYDKDAGSRTVFQYLKLFISRGFNVKFIGDNFYRHEPYTSALQQMGIEVLYGPYYAKEWKHWIKVNADCFDFVFLNRPHIAQKYVDYIRNNTSAKILYYGHDLHFLREMREYELNGDPERLSASGEWKKKEFSIMMKSACVYYPSQVEVEEIKKIDPLVPAKAIPAYLFDNIGQVDYGFDRRKDVMFIGGFSHRPNVDAVCWLAKEIYPQIHQLDPEIKIYILGSNPPPEIQAYDSEHFVVKGFVTDEELVEMYSSTRMSIVPLRYGAGIKGKVIESMYYGCPVMTTSVGAEGIKDANNIMAIEDDAVQFAQHLVELYGNEQELVRMSASYAEYVRQNYTPQKAWEVIGPDFA